MESGVPPIAPEPASADDAAVASAVGTLLRDSTEYARALGQLVASEAELAKVNLQRILLVALIVPAIAGGAVLGLDALFAALLANWLQSWALAIGAVALFNLLLLGAAIWLLYSWWQTLSLPRSRAAFSALWGRQ